MSKYCPETKRRVVYLECLECEKREECGKAGVEKKGKAEEESGTGYDNKKIGK